MSDFESVRFNRILPARPTGGRFLMGPRLQGLLIVYPRRSSPEPSAGAAVGRGAGHLDVKWPELAAVSGLI